ncbi:MAG: hypothetical protein COV47_01485 [Candidatus Diapherotrites archaeon CG11_big_fil_rev_8_21_14_0_20_37_9]|nr:MAG: hypothetical protein COV47_01485 [Candidatus Diapherotrites archaeon CG11_big_fil_rev_8_21_14_0_20_37_9]
MKRGFIFSISTLIITATILASAMFVYNLNAVDEAHIGENFSIEKAGFVAEDVISDINAILGTSVDVNRGEQFTRFSFRTKIPADINNNELNNYAAFAVGNYASAQNADINVGVSNLTDGISELVFSNGMQYDYNYITDSTVQVYMPNGDTGFVAIDINVYISGSSVGANAWTWQDATGDINVNLYFTDLNASNTVTYSGKLDSSIENTYSWDYNATTGESFYITIGAIGNDTNAIRLINSINAPGVIASADIGATSVSGSAELSWWYDGNVSYSQKGMEISKSIILGKS